MIFSDTVLSGGLEKGSVAFQFLELRAPNSSIAFSYEHFSDSPYHRDRTHGAWFYGIFFCVGLASHHLGPWPITYREPNLNRRVIEARLDRGTS